MDSAMTTMMIPELTASPTAPAKTAATTRIATRGQAAQKPVRTARTMSADERIAAVSREAACCFVRVDPLPWRRADQKGIPVAPAKNARSRQMMDHLPASA